MKELLTMLLRPLLEGDSSFWKAVLQVAESIEKSAVGAALCLCRNPNLKARYSYLKLKHGGSLRAIANQYAIRPQTLENQRDKRLDNPAYRFYRDGLFFAYFVAHAEALKGLSWLDVGADTGAVSLYLSEILDSTNFELCDIAPASRCNFPVRRIDGTHLDYADNSFDLVLFSYVLHHAGDNTIRLLRDAWRIARRFVAVTEDPKDIEDDYAWAYTHDRRGTFRGTSEWLQLFSITGFSVVHEQLLNCETHSRRFFLLTPNK
jgi:SAM-dependent methyltransferase